MYPSLFFAQFLGCAVVAQAILDPPAGVHFVGIGYNILTGNPEGGDISIGGVDPGLLLTRKIFRLTYEKQKSSIDLRYRVPDQVSFAPRSVSSCQENERKKVVTGTKSYQDELKVDVTTTAGYDAGLWSVAFSLSSNYQRMETETKSNEKVYYDFKKVCNRGQVRYLLDSAHQQIPGFSVTDDFASAVCSLPDEYEEGRYLEFIDRWGTDIVIQVTLGTKEVTRYRSSRSKFYEYAMENIGNSVKVSGGYKGFSASLEVNVNTFTESMKEGSSLSTEKTVLTAGGADMPEPIKVKLMPIYKAFHIDFFNNPKNPGLSGCSFPQTIGQKSENVKTILKKYPSLKGAHGPEDDLRIPLTWPKGTYGLPMPQSGCPKGENFPWHEGTRYHDTEDDDSNNYWSLPWDLAGIAQKNDMEQKFCIKTSSVGFLPWPKGEYCIYKKGTCPKGFNSGWIKWDDEDDNNRNTRSGAMPDGQYGHDTFINYCCRSDGFATNPVILPTDSRFVLFKKGFQCQYVKGMNVREEYFRFDTEDDDTSNQHGGFIPNGEVNDDVILRYCFYY